MKALYKDVPRNAIFKLYISEMDKPEEPFEARIDGVHIATFEAKDMEVLEITIVPQEAIESLPEAVNIEISQAGGFVHMEAPQPMV